MTETVLATAYAQVFPGEPYPGPEAACQFLVAEILVMREILARNDKDEGRLRGRGEIAHAHDVLVGGLLNDTFYAMLDQHDQIAMKAQAGVLCWALHHDHNQTFRRFLELLGVLLRANGVLVSLKPGEDPE